MLLALTLFFFVVVRPLFRYIKNLRKSGGELSSSKDKPKKSWSIRKFSKFVSVASAALLIGQFQDQIVEFSSSFVGEPPTKPPIMKDARYEHRHQERDRSKGNTHETHSEKIRKNGWSEELVAELLRLQNSEEPRAEEPNFSAEESRIIEEYLTQLERHKLLKSLFGWLARALAFALLYFLTNFVLQLIANRFQNS